MCFCGGGGGGGGGGCNWNKRRNDKIVCEIIGEVLGGLFLPKDPYFL